MLNVSEAIFAWDTQNRGDYDENVASLADRLSRWKAKRIYDPSCGGGESMLYLADDLVVSSGSSPEALREAKLKLMGDGLSAVSVEADTARQPFRDSSLDAVMSLGTLFHRRAADIQQSILEMNRILKEEGILLATFQSTEDWKYGRGRQIEDGTFVLDEPGHTERGRVHHFFTRRSLMGLLKGFRVMELELHRHRGLFQDAEENLKYSVWLVLARKVRANVSVGSQGRGLRTETERPAKADVADDFLDTDFVRAFLQRNGPGFDSSRFQILNCEIKPVRLSKSNAKSVIEFVLYVRDNESQQPLTKTVIGKWRPDDQNREVFDILRELRRRGFDGTDGLNVCEPIVYVPERNLMLTSKAGGVEFQKILTGRRNEGELLESCVIRAARWLVKLHSSQVTFGRRYSMQEEERKLEKWSWHLDWLYPDFAERLNNAIDLLLRRQRSLSSKRFVLIHGDFHHQNIFVDGTDLTVIDFEQSCIFDPARDVGYFIAQLIKNNRKYQLSLDIASLRQRFLDEYTKMMPGGVLERMDTYIARTYLQQLHFYYWTMRHKIDPVEFEFWLRRAEECLQS